MSEFPIKVYSSYWPANSSAVLLQNVASLFICVVTGDRMSVSAVAPVSGSSSLPPQVFIYDHPQGIQRVWRAPNTTTTHHKYTSSEGNEAVVRICRSSRSWKACNGGRKHEWGKKAVAPGGSVNWISLQETNNIRLRWDFLSSKATTPNIQQQLRGIAERQQSEGSRVPKAKPGSPSKLTICGWIWKELFLLPKTS